MKNHLKESHPLPGMDYDVEAILFMGNESCPHCSSGENLSLPFCGFYKHFHALGDYHGGNVHCSLCPFLGSFFCLLAKQGLYSFTALSPGSCFPAPGLKDRLGAMAVRLGRVWFLSLAGGTSSVWPHVHTVFFIPALPLIKLITLLSMGGERSWKQ